MTTPARRHQQRLTAHGLFCEDVRDEKTGMATYVGVHGSQMLVPDFPGLMPKLALVVWVVWPVGQPQPASLRVAISLPHGEEMMTQEQPITMTGPRPPGATRNMATSVTRVTMLNIGCPGWLRAFVEVDGTRYPVAGVYISAAPAPGPDAATTTDSPSNTASPAARRTGEPGARRRRRTNVG